MMKDVVKISKEYYDSSDADVFYYSVWGGEDIHIGIYDDNETDIMTASLKTVKTMTRQLNNITPSSKILDIGAGYGGAARYLAKEFNCRIDCLNLSKKQNKRNEEKNKELGLQDRIKVFYGNFEELPFEDNTYDIVWSEDAILHSGQKKQVIKEVARVLKTGGEFIFTDPMQSDDCPEGVLENIYARINLDSMGSLNFYRTACQNEGMKEIKFVDLSNQLINHYSNVKNLLLKKKSDLEGNISSEYIEKMLKGLDHWVEGGKQGYLKWGILQFVKL